ncbi:ABC transporter ATP-binding protein [Streptacidiphilus rugosus]|uniref:ABC transporter ATP-binding protein n=1 Tax=Streptacidiphilus rugosus TaxID=405783 RepID=UPI0007C7C991|nr:ATP-binding cassette domain-containing protein [Streptacidiphilus rugosus]
MGDYQGATVVAEGLTLRGPRGVVYQDVSFEAGPGQLVALVGDSGSGRTSLLLTVAGRMRPSAGQASVDGRPLPRRAGAVRRRVALGPVAGVNDLDGALTVEEHLTERLLLRAHGPGAARRVAAALAATGLDAADLPRRADTLTALQSFRTATAAALLSGPRVLAVDDVGDRLDAADRDTAWQALRALADAGLTVVATGREEPAIADVVVTLDRDGARGNVAGVGRDGADGAGGSGDETDGADRTDEGGDENE